MQQFNEKKVREIIRHFIISQIRFETLADNDDIFQLGLVNSLFAIQLVSFVEKEFKFSTARNELKIENFSCINNITNFVIQKLSTTSTAEASQVSS